MTRAGGSIFRVSVQMHAERPEDTMVFLFYDSRNSKAIMREFSKRFPNYHSIDVAPADAWGRRRLDTECCPACGQPDNCGDCNHGKLSDIDLACIDPDGAAETTKTEGGR
jgi:hypothetical protein